MKLFVYNSNMHWWQGVCIYVTRSWRWHRVHPCMPRWTTDRLSEGVCTYCTSVGMDSSRMQEGNTRVSTTHKSPFSWTNVAAGHNPPWTQVLLKPCLNTAQGLPHKLRKNQHLKGGFPVKFTRSAHLQLVWDGIPLTNVVLFLLWQLCTLLLKTLYDLLS